MADLDCPKRRRRRRSRSAGSRRRPTTNSRRPSASTSGGCGIKRSPILPKSRSANQRTPGAMVMVLLHCVAAVVLLLAVATNPALVANAQEVPTALVVPEEVGEVGGSAAAAVAAANQQQRRRQQQQCTVPKRVDPSVAAVPSSPSSLSDTVGTSATAQPVKTYQVGVLAIRGFDAAYAEFNATFSTYLTLAAGRAFDPPIAFQLRPLNFVSLFGDVQIEPTPAVDFIYVNPSAYACIESEFSAHSLVSQISRRNVGGNAYDLTKFGGVIAVRSDRTDLQSLADIRGRVVAAASISGLGSGQMQFRELQRAGMSYINAPRQLVFTSNQGKVVNGVLDGKFDVAFVRTDQIERTKNATGELVDPARLRILQPQPGLAIDGVAFPFESSTPLYPEWNLASLGHVSDEVASEVQAAMRALAGHADVGYAILGCYEECAAGDGDADDGAEEEMAGGGGAGGGGGGLVGAALEECRAACRDDADLTAGGRCDTTVELALAAAEAKTNGKYTGWRSTLSYMELRNMQVETNFIRRNETSGLQQCIRSSKIYDAIVCPPGHFRRREEEVLAGCALAGLPCDEGFQCICRPCVKSFDVDVFPVGYHVEDGLGLVRDADGSNGQTTVAASASVDDEEKAAGCPKMELCGSIEQTKPIRFRAVDNKKRSGVDLSVFVHAGQSKTREIHATPVLPTGNETETFMYEFVISEPRVGVVVLEILADGEQIPESPLRLEVKPRNCAADNGDTLSVAQADGSCSCVANAVDIGGQCVSYAILLPAIILPLLAIAAVAISFYIKQKHKIADSVWHVKEKELEFEDPPQIIGRGTFGLVLLAEYRGTQVAVKRVIPPKRRKSEDKGKSSTTLSNGSSSTTFDKRYSFLPSGGRSRDSIVAPATSGRLASLEGIVECDDESAADSSHAGSRKQTKMRRHSSGMSPSRRAASDKSLLSDSDDDANDACGRATQSMEKPLQRRSSDDMQRRKSSLGGMAKRRSSSIGRMGSDDVGDDKQRRRLSAYNAFDMTDDPELGKSSNAFNDSNGNFSSDGLESGGLRNASGAFDASAIFDGQGFGTSSGDMPTNTSSAKKRGRRASDTSSRRRSNDSSGSGGGSSYSDSFSKKSNWLLRNIGLASKDEYAKLKADFIVEMRHLSKLRHPCITTVMGAVIEKGVEPMLIMEFMDMGSLHDILHNESFPLDGDLLLPILRDIAQGVRFLHAAKPQVIHGDLKAHNVLVDGKFRAKVADFGLSAKKIIGATGTPFWMAPELLRGDSSNTAASDVYSFGIILYEVYSRKDPYEGENAVSVLRDVADRKINKRPPVPSACPLKVQAIMSDCLAGNPKDRPHVEEIDLRLKRLSVENVEPGEMHLSHQARKHLKARRGEDLISKMFPKHIADQLREGRKPEPENRDMVTIFFSDIVGFTNISSKLPAEQVSDMLDRLYLRFDALADKHDVFKIETIGDAFIGVANLVKDQNDHTKRVAEFAIDCNEAARQTLISLEDPSMGHVIIRVGLHSGPVIASVVGSRLPKYTILGDSVNTAARMESASLPGRIQCTEQSARLLARQCPAIPIAPRGEISIKGKGEMVTFWINEVSSPSRKHLLPSADSKKDVKQSPPRSMTKETAPEAQDQDIEAQN